MQALRVEAGEDVVVPADLHEQIVRSRVRILGLAADHGLAVAALPLHHRDASTGC